MGFNCGIVGLPNVGKSTIFNALTSTAAAEAANYPFCTIEPNVGKVSVPDDNLQKISSIANSQKIIPNQLGFVDIAGLVRGASKGEGLGNQFLSHIREVDAIIHVLRCFENSDITHVDDSVDPLRDAETIETELMLADLQSLENRKQNIVKKARSQDKEAKKTLEIVERLISHLGEGKPVRQFSYDTDDEQIIVKNMQLLTYKPILYVCNVDESDVLTGNNFTNEVTKKAAQEKTQAVIVSAAIEEEISQLKDMSEKQDFLKTYGLENTGLSKLIHAGFQLLDLLTFYTVGPKEARAWTVKNGAKAPQAAGVIHTDFEKGFIRAETISLNDYIEFNGENGAKEYGKMRLEGKDYLVQNGDIFHFRFNV